MTLTQIREDLKDVRYYYARRQVFEEAEKTVGVSGVTEKLGRYNGAVRVAPPRLYDLYVGLYVKNYTQEALSAELGYTPEYVQMQNKKLLLYLQSKLTDKGEST